MSATDHDHPAHEDAGPGHDHGHGHGHAHRGGVVGFVLSLVRPHSHDAADSLDAALQASAAGIRAVKISLVVLMATAIAQLVVVLYTGSVALLADTIHNFSDALTALPRCRAAARAVVHTTAGAVRHRAHRRTSPSHPLTPTVFTPPSGSRR